MNIDKYWNEEERSYIRTDDNGQVIRLVPQMFNWKVNASNSINDLTWHSGY